MQGEKSSAIKLCRVLVTDRGKTHGGGEVFGSRPGMSGLHRQQQVATKQAQERVHSCPNPITAAFIPGNKPAPVSPCYLAHCQPLFCYFVQ
jgi:hypothetical protein